MKNKKANLGSFATVKLQAIRLCLIAALVAVIGFGVASCSGGSDDKDGTTTGDGSGNSNGDGKGDGSGTGKSNWLPAHHKRYTVTDGVAGNVDYEYDITYTSYTDDKHYARQYSQTTPINIREETETYTFTRVGSNQGSVNESRDGNTAQTTNHVTLDYTETTTYKDPSSSSSNSTKRTTAIDQTITYTYVYDNDSGIQKSYTYQETGTSYGSPINTSRQSTSTIELLSTEGSVKTYKSYLSSATSNGTSLDVSSNQSYSVYKIQNGITLEQKNYQAGVLSQTITYSIPDNAVIKSKLPDYTIPSITSYGSDGSTSTSYTTAEVVSDSNTELRILWKGYVAGKLYGQYEETYRPKS